MSSRTRFASLSIAIFALAFLVACGSSSNSATAPPTGGFTNADFSGTYVFSVAGYDYTSTNLADSALNFAAVGSLTATPGSGSTNGSLSGTIDLNDPELGYALGANSNVMTVLAASGSYTISVDGRGTGTLSVSIPTSSGTESYPIVLDFVMTSSSHGLVTRFDANGTGSGTIDAQTSSVPQSALVGSYSFALSGVDSFSSNGGNPLGSVGTFTLDGSGNATGVVDFNDNGNSSSSLTNLTLQSGSTVLAGSPGTSTLLNNGAYNGLTFDVWVIDSTHLKLIETDTTGPVLEGDAYVSTGQSFPANNLVFTMSGYDDGGFPLAIGGLISTASNPNSNAGEEDVNDAGSVAQAPAITSSYSTSGGRTLFTLGNIYNGGWPNLSTSAVGTYTFAAYPFSYGTSGVGAVLLEVDGAGGMTAGTAYLQSTTSLAASTSSQGYGLNLSGLYLGENDETGEEDIGGEADMIAEFTATSTNITGLYDVNNSFDALISDEEFGSTNSPGTYSISGGRGTATVPLQTPGGSSSQNAVIDELDFTFYTVDSSNNAFIETDQEQITTGSFQLQNASGTSSQARPLPSFAMVHPSAKSAKARQNLKKK
jgi:hypothetical protein